MIDAKTWAKRRVLVTGHTGFKGAWLSHWLAEMGADVAGISLAPNTSPNLFQESDLPARLQSHTFDIRDLAQMQKTFLSVAPDVVFHLAAQPLVRHSYRDPIESFSTNVMGTANVLECIRNTPSVKACVVITTDKVYENQEWTWGYRENEKLGGKDPYSASKAAAEMITQSYRDSFFKQGSATCVRAVPIASARAGNVIGGGDWADDRLVPDIVRAWRARKILEIRYPQAVRPWQHVLEPLGGYLLLAEKLLSNGASFADAWNFGPAHSDCAPVMTIVEQCRKHFGPKLEVRTSAEPQPHEAHLLKLDSSKAIDRLGWHPILRAPEAIDWTLAWYKRHADGESARALVEEQLGAFMRRMQDFKIAH